MAFFSELACVGPAIEQTMDIMSTIKLVHKWKKNKKWPIFHQSRCSGFSRDPFQGKQRSFSSKQNQPLSENYSFCSPTAILFVSILQTYCLWTTSSFINHLIMSFHIIFCGSKFQRFTTYCIKKLFLLSVWKKPKKPFSYFLASFIAWCVVLNNITTFSSPGVFTFSKSLWFHTSDSWIV